MSNTLKNPGLGNSGSFGILLLVVVARVALIAFCAWNASLYFKILMSFFQPEGQFFGFLIGFVSLILWAMLQVLEVLPLLVKGSLGAMALLIKAAERFRGLEVSKSDNPLVASLKTQYNAYPQRWLGRIMLLCYAAFACDLAILLQYFRPFSISFTGLSINWADLLWLLICLSTVQVVAFVWLLAEGGKAVFKPERQPTVAFGGGSGGGGKPKEPTKSAAPKDAAKDETPVIQHLRQQYGDEAVDEAIARVQGNADKAQSFGQQLKDQVSQIFGGGSKEPKVAPGYENVDRNVYTHVDENGVPYRPMTLGDLGAFLGGGDSNGKK